MYARCAYFEGDVAPADRPRFDRAYRDIIAPTMARFPKVKYVRLLWGREFEAQDRRFYLVVEHAYDTLDDIAAALRSKERAGLQSTLDEVVPLFDGKVYHVNHEVTEYP